MIRKLSCWIILFAALSVSLLACQAPREQAFSPASTSPRLTDDAIIAVDGVRLRLQSWLPTDDTSPKAVILALHGFNDYSNTFTSFGEYARTQGIAVYAYDQRGYGKSGEWGIWAGEKNLVRDLATVSALLAIRYPHIPLYVMGESMGGAIVILAARADVLPARMEGLLLSAPAVWGGDFMPWWYRAPLWMMAHSIPASQFSGRGLGYVPSDNEEMLRALGRDPLIIKKSRIDTVYGVGKIMDKAHIHAASITHPTLLLYGAHDDIIPAEPTYAVMMQLRKDGQRTAYYPDGYHMLTRDLQQAFVHEDIVTWVRSGGKAALPSGADKEATQRMREDNKK